MATFRVDFLGCKVSHADAHEVREGRIAETLTRAQFGGGEAFVVVSSSGFDRIVVRRVRLDDHAPRTLASPGTARDLREQLERPFGGAEAAWAPPEESQHPRVRVF